ncbi:MAG: hypothetical protein CR982_02690 [Candidatus Cloacimonadota bacterium]|nr:MAG: hypothetical protein CR982_02690 [Candidatus Cloacimonadota bacterium]PIE79337.1 MAG: hypothetical protein CSA15_03545 [Candidatus Delongbacteria bacterium]
MKKLVLILFMVVLAFSRDLPTQFDLRDYNGVNYVSSVKNQDGGTCWTHAVMAAMESNIMRTDQYYQENEPNFSEYHLDWWNGFNQFQNLDAEPTTGNGLEVHQGGDYLVASAYITRGDGVVMGEGSHSFETAPPFESDLYQRFAPKHIEWYTMDQDLNGIDEIKECIMENGAIGTCMAYNNQFIDYDYNHYQPYSSNMLPNHAVTIVGWDDEREIYSAPAPGAWIVKNSWGEYWGHNGYFYISYYDKWSCKEEFMGAVSFKDVEEKDFYEDCPPSKEIYIHDYHGWRDTVEEISEAVNYFYVEGFENEYNLISRVSFFTPVDNCEFDLKIYNGFENGELTDLICETSGSFEKRGFHEVSLEEFGASTSISPDTYVYLKFNNGGHPIDRTSDVPVLLGAEPTKTIVTSKASPGESFYKDGNEWKDLYDYDLGEFSQSANFCMKLHINSYTSIDENIIKDHSILRNYPNPFNPTTTLSFDLGYDSSNIQIVIFDVSGSIVKSYQLGAQKAGVHKVDFDGSSLSSGTYYAKLISNGMAISTNKMVLIK